MCIKICELCYYVLKQKGEIILDFSNYAKNLASTIHKSLSKPYFQGNSYIPCKHVFNKNKKRGSALGFGGSTACHSY